MKARISHVSGFILSASSEWRSVFARIETVGGPNFQPSDLHFRSSVALW